MIPQNSQTIKLNPIDPEFSRTPTGEMKIPEPIIDPTITHTPPTSPI